MIGCAIHGWDTSKLHEIWTFVLIKENALRVNRGNHYRVGEQCVFIAFDEDTKVTASYALGKRTRDNPRRVLVDLFGRLLWPKPQQSDPDAFRTGAYGAVTRLSSHAFAGYPEAIDLAFGPYVDYGHIARQYANADHAGRYGPAEMIHAERRTRFGELDKRSICSLHNFCCRPRRGGSSWQRPPTAAIAGGIIDSLCTLEDLLEALSDG